MSTNTVVLITGANRGIGHALTAEYLSRPHTTLIAAVRDPKANSKALETLPKGTGSTLLTVKIDSLSPTDAKAAIAALPPSFPHIDLVIANAGVTVFNPVLDITVDEYLYHQNINVLGPLLLFQATWPLLQKSAAPKFIVISSSLGSVKAGPEWGMPSGAYGASKASINYLTRKLHFEHERLVALPICPGWTQTDMGNESAAVFRAAEGGLAPVTLEDSIRGVVKEIDGAIRTEEGRFACYDHKDVAW
ncbi:NAD(P)-binding protein [Mytilinidion resinicola]|uniref:NAD(P)-binding protein n=1 Tax=Mytilinidion resinicola TaxID=574789 RepID=A0A6A6YA35_9PEZI|nr:NAD(P)-binding protein [Mytilinidion resinicola]KAF2805676.1 NAD(P)-binding protein [Mytilinidion resinicola]